MSGVKIQLSTEEQEMAANTGIILTKNRIMAAVMEMFGDLSEAAVFYADEHRNRLPEGIFRVPPKISRGENYQQLPWVMLDYPRVFEPSETIAIRHFFWWGNFFSVSIQVSGRFRQQLLDKVGEWPGNTHICVQASPWEHHFGQDNYLPITGMHREEILSIARERDFLKLSMAIPVSQWASSPTFLLNGFNNFLNLLLD
ncbi:hypothetical protein [Flavihumibacter fluvii]|uniref:hypothetical protein n=1 Tax=Flavihumibacter fluvii TaxID=2838157 RepID=UPI001BDE14A0|nr:hypothetical protein [Flavihumibacter fluvii]ULQ50816.1 hypothetical protein KJS93_12055 [Flavihumibacter fluvii]